MMAERAQKKLLSVRQSLEKHLIITGGVDTLLTKERIAILAKKPMDLLQELKDGKVSVIAVLEAFQAKVRKFVFSQIIVKNYSYHMKEI